MRILQGKTYNKKDIKNVDNDYTWLYNLKHRKPSRNIGNQKGAKTYENNRSDTEERWQMLLLLSGDIYEYGFIFI